MYDDYDIVHTTQVAWSTGLVFRIRLLLCISPPPLGRFCIVDFSTVGNSVGAKKVVVGNVSPRAFRTRIARYWHLLALLAPIGTIATYWHYYHLLALLAPIGTIGTYWHYWHPLGCRAIELSKPPQGGVIQGCDLRTPSGTGR